MKKLMFVCFAAAAMWSCSEANVDETPAVGDGNLRHLTVVTGVDTRVAMDDSNVIAWEAGDKVAVVDNVKGLSESDALKEGGAKGHFSVSVDPTAEKLVLFYPGDNQNNTYLDGYKLQFDVAAEQTQAKAGAWSMASFPLYSTAVVELGAEDTTVNSPMTLAAAVARFFVYGDVQHTTEKVLAVSVAADNALNGQVYLEGDWAGKHEAEYAHGSGATTVTLDSGYSLTGTNHDLTNGVYLAVVPADYTNLVYTVTTDRGTYTVKSAKKEFKANTIHDLYFNLDGEGVEHTGAEFSIIEDFFIDYTTAGGYYYWNQGITPELKDGALVVSSTEEAANNWDYQYFVADGVSINSGVAYTITIRMKGSTAGSLNAAFGDWSTSANATVNFTTAMQNISVTIIGNVDAANAHLLLQSGKFVGDLTIESVKITHEVGAKPATFTSLISGGDAENGASKYILSNEQNDSSQNGKDSCKIGEAGTGADGVGHAFVVYSGDDPEQTYATQFNVYSADRVLKAGDVVILSFDYRADKAAGSESQSYGEPGAYIYWNAGAAVTFTTEWQHFESRMILSSDVAGANGMQTFTWNLGVLKEANVYYFDNVNLILEE